MRAIRRFMIELTPTTQTMQPDPCSMRSLIPKEILTQDDERLEHNHHSDTEQINHIADIQPPCIDVLSPTAPPQPPQRTSIYDAWQPLPTLPQTSYYHNDSFGPFSTSLSSDVEQHNENETVFSDYVPRETSSSTPSSHMISEDESLVVERYMEEIDRYMSQIDGYVGSIAADATSNREIHHYLAYKKAESFYNARIADPTDPFAHRRIYAAVEKEYADEGPPEVFHELPNRDRTRNQRSEWTQKDIEDYYPCIKDPSDPARILRPKEITFQRAVFLAIVISSLGTGIHSLYQIKRLHFSFVGCFEPFIQESTLLDTSAKRSSAPMDPEPYSKYVFWLW
jgi:hypothetical protein